MSEELDTAKEGLSYHEREYCEKCNQEDKYEKENLVLVQRKSEVEDKRKDINGKLEETKTEHECLAHDLTEVRKNLERTQYVWLIFSLIFLIIALYYNLQVMQTIFQFSSACQIVMLLCHWW
jgi:hypothetical protein